MTQQEELMPFKPKTNRVMPLRNNNPKYVEHLTHIGRVDWQKGIAAAELVALELAAKHGYCIARLHSDARIGDKSDKGHTMTHWEFAVEQVAKLLCEGKLQDAWDKCVDYERVAGIDPRKLKDAAELKARVPVTKR